MLKKNQYTLPQPAPNFIFWRESLYDFLCLHQISSFETVYKCFSWQQEFCIISPFSCSSIFFQFTNSKTQKPLKLYRLIAQTESSGECWVLGHLKVDSFFSVQRINWKKEAYGAFLFSNTRINSFSLLSFL